MVMVFRCSDGFPCGGPNSGSGERVLPFKTQSCDGVEDIAILQIGEPGRTVEQFFHDVAWAKIQSTSSTTIELISAYLGRSKESLDEIELSIRLDLAVATYGGYLRYVISTRTKVTEASSECIC